MLASMSPRSSSGASRAQQQASLAGVRVDRARTELRHGRAIVLHDDASGNHLLAAAVETLEAHRLEELLHSGLPLRLLLTAERMQAMGWSSTSTTTSTGSTLPLPTAPTLAQLQVLAGVSPGNDRPPLPGDASPADAPMAAALALAKRGRLTPALLVARLPVAGDGAWQRWLDERQVLRLSAADVALAGPSGTALRRVSDAHVPIAAAEDCELVLYREIDGDAEHVAIVVGRPLVAAPVAVRLHSACLTGDLLGSLRCDCGDQLRRAIDQLAKDGGVLLYLAQEGRGTGLASKLRAYRLQDGGLDTLQADRQLGFRADERDFRAAAAMLQDLGIARVRLLTNNPAKIAALRDAGIEVVDRLPLGAAVTPHNARYMQTKQEQAGHWRGEERLA